MSKFIIKGKTIEGGNYYWLYLHTVCTWDIGYISLTGEVICTQYEANLTDISEVGQQIPSNDKLIKVKRDGSIDDLLTEAQKLIDKYFNKTN